MLRIENLTKIYGEHKAVDDLSLHIAPGEIYGFIGHNGAGKTTTLKSVAGILRFDAGDIFINGKSIKAEPVACKREMAYIPDNPDMYEFLSGIKYLNFVADIYGMGKAEREERITEYADMFEITKILSMFMKSSHIITEREKFLQNKVDNDAYGVFTLSKFEEEVGRITRNAHVTNKKIGFVYFNFNRFYEFNRIYGREEGDRVLKQFAKFLLDSSEDVCVNCHLNGTDKFINCFMFEEGVDLETKIQQKLEAFSDTVGNYKECPVVITAGVAMINPGENVTEALDLANHTVKGVNAEKSICIMAKE